MDPDAYLWGGELLVRGGEPVGQVTSAAYSATLGAAVGLAWVWNPDGSVVDRAIADLPGYAVDIAGTQSAVRVSLRAPRS